MKVPINESDGSINIQELEQNLLGDANWIPRLNTLVLAEINNNLRAIANQLEESESRKIMRDARDNVNDTIKTHLPPGFAFAKGSKKILVETDEFGNTSTPCHQGKEYFNPHKPFEQRPWGGFEVLVEGEGYKVKRIWVNPGEAISLQSHKLREEVWTVVRGRGEFDSGGACMKIPLSIEHDIVKTITIGKEKKHRITNILKNEILEFIEVQTGECREDDIIRYEDKYGRA